MQYMINQSDYYRKLMSSFFFLLPGTMEAKFILIAVIIPIIASQGINKGKNSMLKTIIFFKESANPNITCTEELQQTYLHVKKIVLNDTCKGDTRSVFRTIT